ncbi:MAG: sulfatase-like hydrolase/transferase [Pseudomonadota bacterium]|nr:sulfatase-like hydrolase/transferase [Pseudomonadota bacterium]
MSNDRPNFLLFVTDQHRADHLSCYGNTLLKTPKIDALADKGIKFTQFYVASPVCTPNRATLMTGRMPSINGARMNGVPLPLETNTFVEELRVAGYKTALVGKCHLQTVSPREQSIQEFPNIHKNESIRSDLGGNHYKMEMRELWLSNPNREIIKPYYGFDHITLCDGHGDSCYGHYSNWAHELDPNYSSLIGPENALQYDGFDFGQAWRTALPEELYSTTFIAEKTMEFLSEVSNSQNSHPFFIQCSFPDPHHPFTPPGKYWDMYDPVDCTPPYSSTADLINPPPMTLRLKEEVLKNVRQQYPYAAYAVRDENEIRESMALTYGMISMVDDAIGRIISKLSETGLQDNTVVIFTSDHGELMGDHGLMIKHCFHHQGLIRVPFIWCDPHSEEVCVTDRLSSTLDIAPSILSRSGLTNYNGMQGVDLFNSVSDRRGLIIEEDETNSNANCGNYTRTRTFVNKRWRLTLWLEEEFGEFYDRENDPHEINNLWDNPSAAKDKAEIISMMLEERLKLDDLSPRPKFPG